MKIIIFSDSHGNIDAVNKIFKMNADAYFFLGDGLSDLGSYANLPNVYCVKGNCDILDFNNTPTQRIVELGSVKFLLVHGHTFGVKSTLYNLCAYAHINKVDFVIYGHTHTYDLQKIDNITFLNPGSLAKIKGGNECFVTLNIENKKYNILREFF